MRKPIFALLGLLFAFTIFADSLYDVNYDVPVSSSEYDSEVLVFQEIYLQYESVIKSFGEMVKGKEKNNYQAELRKIKSEEKYNYETALANMRAEEKNKFSDELVKVRAEEKAYYDTELSKIKTEEKNRYEMLLQNFMEKEKKDRQELIDNMRREIYSLEGEKMREAEIAYLTPLLTEKLRAELTVQYENKKNEELIALRKQLKTEIYEETNIITERIRIVAQNILVFILLVVAVAFLFMIIKKIKKAILEKAENNKNIEYYANKYMPSLQKNYGKTFEVDDEIDKQNDSDEKKLMKLGLERAEQRYKLPTVEQYAKELEDMSPAKKFRDWNGAKNDKELKNGLCNEFFNNIRAYSAKRIEIYGTRHKRSAEDISALNTLLVQYAETFSNISEQVEMLIEGKDRQIDNKLKKIAAGYKKLTAGFKRSKM